jgi:hypothetical protein
VKDRGLQRRGLLREERSWHLHDQQHQCRTGVRRLVCRPVRRRPEARVEPASDLPRLELCGAALPATAGGHRRHVDLPRGRADGLPSSNDGASRKAIIGFVDRVTRQGGADFVPPSERIATFDNDGTRWSEQPVLLPGRLRTRSRQGACGATPGVETEAALRGYSRRRHESRRGDRRKGAAGSDGRHPSGTPPRSSRRS